MSQARVIHKVGLAVLRNQKIMMLRDDHNDEVFYFAGGTVEQGESDLTCLKREIREELAVSVDETTLKFLGAFEAPAHGKANTVVSIQLYQGAVIGEPTPSSEIVQIAYFDSAVDPKHLTAIAIDHIFPWLKRHKLIA